MLCLFFRAERFVGGGVHQVAVLRDFPHLDEPGVIGSLVDALRGVEKLLVDGGNRAPHRAVQVGDRF